MAKNSKPLTEEEKAAKAEKAKKAADAKAARDKKKAEAEAAAAAEVINCSVEGCENAATVTAEVDGDKVDSCAEHQEALSEEFELSAEDWQPIVAEKPKDEPKASRSTSKRNREVEAPLPGKTYSQTRRAQLVQAIAAGGVVKLRDGTIVTKVEDLP